MDDPSAAERARWTGALVKVQAIDPTLSRFADRVGRVITVNMNGRALVRFENTADIGWHDVPVQALVAMPQDVTADPALGAGDRNTNAPPAIPRPAAPPESPSQPVPAETPAPAAEKKPAARMSILEQARKQGAASR